MVCSCHATNGEVHPGPNVFNTEKKCRGMEHFPNLKIIGIGHMEELGLRSVPGKYVLLLDIYWVLSWIGMHFFLCSVCINTEHTENLTE